MARNQRRFGIAPRLDRLETREMMSSGMSGTLLPSTPALREDNSLIVRFDDSATPERRTAAAAAAGGSIASASPGGADFLVFRDGFNLDDAAARLALAPGVLYAERNRTVSILAVPNDPSFSDLWGLGASSVASTNATDAWDIATGSPTVTVAVTDTGVDYDHPDLYLNIAVDQKELPAAQKARVQDTNGDGLIDFYDFNSLDASRNRVQGIGGSPVNAGLVADSNSDGRISGSDLLADPRWADGLDQDADGLADDLVGQKFLYGAASDAPRDDHWHGTHVSGAIGAIGDNGLGVAGVSWNVRILPVKSFNSTGNGTLADAITSIRYAADQGAKIINASWGFGGTSSALQDAVSYAGSKGSVIVAAAGNDASNNDNTPFMPASIRLPNVISVAALTEFGPLAAFSNWGPQTVDIAAPGDSILSTTPNGGYGWASGTSMAAPYVSGALALLAYQRPDLTAAGLVSRIKQTAKSMPDLVGRVLTNGQLDIATALAPSVPDSPPSFALADGGFETPAQGSGYTYRPAGSAWAFTLGAGLTANNTAFTSLNPAAPQGSQVAFLQGTGSTITQSVANWPAGNYRVSFRAARRGSNGGAQDFAVTLDGVAVGTFTASQTAYASFATAAFSVTAGAHAIGFRAINSAGGDNTAFLDAVSVEQLDAPGLADGGFETPAQGSGYTYRPAGSAWAFTLGAGLTANNTAFTSLNPAAPQGSQVAFLQGTGSTITQSVANWPAGNYRVSFRAARRGSNGGAQDFAVTLDGVAVGTFTASQTAYASFATAAFSVTAGAHAIGFRAINSAGGDNTAFLDAVSVEQLDAPGLADGGFETPAQGSGYTYRPAGSAWAFTLGAGLTANNTAFTSLNPAAPQGSQVAFLQGTGSTITQSVANWPAGNYRVSFRAARRGSNGGAQDFAVTLDGVAVGTFTASQTAYASFATAAFSVTAGAHAIGFRAINSAGGDNTAFLDAVSVERV